MTKLSMWDLPPDFHSQTETKGRYDIKKMTKAEKEHSGLCEEISVMAWKFLEYGNF